MILIIILTILIVLLISFVKRQYTYWDSYDIPHLRAKFPFGNLESIVKKQRSFGTAIYDIYRNSKDQILGIYLFFKPAILIRDPVLIKNVLTTDFEHFHDRGVYVDTKRDVMSGNLFSLEGKEWKSLRTRLTPAFTSGKLKGMFENIKSIGSNLVDFMQSHAEEQAEIEIRDIATRYVADCLALIAFGQEGISCIDNPDHEFRTNARELNSNKSIFDVIRRSSIFICPGLIKLLRLKGLPPFIRKFCLDMVTKTVQYREANNIVRKDLMQYLIQLRNNSSTEVDEWKIKTSAKDAKSMSYEQIAANIFIFYIAGTESSSSTIAYTLYELTQNEDLMERAKMDILETLERHDGKITYESIMEMKFIDLCVKETLRKYPGLPILNRECTKDFKIPDNDFTIKKGTSVIISLLGISRDEKFFPNAEKYNPDRFTSIDFNEDMYIPFGTGPRNCIAFRMGLLVVKVAVVMLLKNFNFKALSIKELEFDFGTVGLLPKEGECVIKILKEINAKQE
ncbi:cytochrome P450 6d3-like [Chironomus tepperi]|uniref:cytochrome P450 6d3-like n=1 Tax=Chironomus tepperi TaxID=113505 RepID=UPI00391F0F08